MADADMVPLLRVCALLNAQKAKYLVIGGRACILHGAVRTTQDVDILIEATGRTHKKFSSPSLKWRMARPPS